MKKNIRNFSIIAHIDHGKSTLSDRIIEICTNIKISKSKSRILDSMDIEKEKGITIKAQSVCLNYKFNDKKYKLNLIDTPGHIDFSYEVYKSLYSCEGALLLIDVSKGIQAQTITNYNIAKKLKIKIIIIINKIDLLYKDINNVKNQIKKIFNIKQKNILLCSAKSGIGIKNILNTIIKKIPYPSGSIKLPLQAIIIDSYFNNYLGIFCLIKIINGYLIKNDLIKIINNNNIYQIKTIHIYNPYEKKINKLICGEVGWISFNMKKIKYFNPIGKTITKNYNYNVNELIYLKKIKPQIYASIYPKNKKEFLMLKNSIKKLSLNDSSFIFKQENSNILGNGFRCGFLGILHIEIFKERLKREYKLKILITSPTVIYKIINKKKKNIYINNINDLPKKNEIKEIQEPISICNIISPKKYLGKIIKLCIFKRGKQKKILFFNNNISIIYKIPTYEIITNFSDYIKSISNGYASFEYKFYKYKKSNISLLEIMINNNKIKNFSILMHNKNIKIYSKNLINIIKNNLKKQQFETKIQALYNNKIIYSIKLKSLRKNVISKCYGGDITRKKKLLEKQKKGKKKLKKIGNILISEKIFSDILKIKD